MQIRADRIAKIFSERFPKAGQQDVEDWLFGCVRAWVATGKIVSFSPFEEFFPSVEPEEMCLAEVGAGFPEGKEPGAKYSPAVLFRRALGNIVAREGLYIDSIDSWRFALGVAEHLRLHEVSVVLSGLIGYEPFRHAGRDEGFSLFRDAFETVDRLGPDMHARKFWKACLPCISEYPALSLRLLQNLVQCEPSRWAVFATDKRMAEALISHRLNQMSTLNEPFLMEFDVAAHEISKCVSDSDYSKHWSLLRTTGLDFLIDRSRLIQLEESSELAQQEGAQDKRQRSGSGAYCKEAKGRNLRKRAGYANRRRLEAAA